VDGLPERPAALKAVFRLPGQSLHANPFEHRIDQFGGAAVPSSSRFP
jgi:hypothetical protein